ncbi:hypothetical protein PsYK624_047970 [Phanerochaete sordida]|uniref:Uncharacterized protein n=1 Tax=Phanerochaete sordida TaxID=48140 RepID=A0A9P3G772_9APHY|nr:hypothetical protein PsYK624_047970 [Phanerochaete sordida]
MSNQAAPAPGHLVVAGYLVLPSRDHEDLLQELRDLDTLVESDNYPCPAEVKQIQAVTEPSDFHFKLAPLYGDLRWKHIKMMDAALQLATERTRYRFAKREGAALSFQDAVEILQQDAALQLAAGQIFQQSSWKGKPKGFLADDALEVVSEIEKWLGDLVKNGDVLKAMNIDLRDVSRIITGDNVPMRRIAAQGWLPGYAKEGYSEVLFDSGILRFPDKENPFFTVYHLRLDVWIEREKYFGIVAREHRGGHGVYTAQNIRLRDDVLGIIVPQVREQAKKEVVLLVS